MDYYHTPYYANKNTFSLIQELSYKNKLLSKSNYIFLGCILLCTPFIYLMSKNGINLGIFFIGAIGFMIISILCISNYVIGLYLITILSFCIFTISRYIDTDIPWGFAIEILIYITTLGMFVSNKIRNQHTKYKLKNPIFIILTIFLIYSIFTVINPEMNSKIGWLIEIKRLIALYCYFLIIFIGIDSLKEQIKYNKLIIILFVIGGIYGCYQHIFGFFEFENNYILNSENRKNLYMMITGMKRIFSLFSDPSSLGISMAGISGMILTLFSSEKTIKNKIIYSISIMVCLLTMAFSGTRTAYIAFLSGVIFYILININNATSRLLGFIFLIGFIFILIVPIYNNTTLNRVRSAFEFSKEASMSVRDNNRKMIQPYMQNHPFGGGLGTSEGRGIEFNPRHRLAGFPPDSGLLKTAIEIGWIGLIIMMVQYFIIFNEGVKSYFSKTKKIDRSLISSSLVCIFIFVVAQYSQVAVGQIPDSLLFMNAVAIIAKKSH